MKEIERKFLVNERIHTLLEKNECQLIRQGYIAQEKGLTVRVRTKGLRGFLTVKGKTLGISRSEYEYEIPYTDAVSMLEEFCSAVITKKRYLIQHENLVWEVDEFTGKLSGLMVAEIELQSEDEQVALPDWVATEVTHDPTYRNSELVKRLEESRL